MNFDSKQLSSNLATEQEQINVYMKLTDSLATEQKTSDSQQLSNNLANQQNRNDCKFLIWAEEKLLWKHEQ